MQLSHHLGLALPITSEFRRVADAFATQCSVREKADRIRRNTLAVCVVDAYMQMMDIPTDIGGGDSWQPMMQILADVADLHLPGVGVLSCRTVLKESKTCYIPPEEWENRLGYVAVDLDEQNNLATLVGFSPSANEQTHVPIALFSPVESLIDRIHVLQADRSAARSVADSATTAQLTITRLSQWVEGQLDSFANAGWQAVEQLLNPTELGFAFRSVGMIDAPIVDISRAKLLNLGIQFDRTIRVALVIRLARSAASEAREIEETDAEETGTPQTHITLQVRPIETSDYLPEGLLLSVLDDGGNEVATATSRAIDNYIQLQLTGESQEQFGVQVRLGEARFEERFVI